jgi:hypothetical protein
MASASSLASAPFAEDCFHLFIPSHCNYGPSIEVATIYDHRHRALSNPRRLARAWSCSGSGPVIGYRVPRQEFIEPVDRVSLDRAAEHIAQPGLWFDAVELAGFDERTDDRPAVAATIAAGEQVVLAAKGDGTDRAFDRIGVELNAAVVQEAGQPGPPRERIADRLGLCAAAGDLHKLCFQPRARRPRQLSIDSAAPRADGAAAGREPPLRSRKARRSGATPRPPGGDPVASATS